MNDKSINSLLESPDWPAIYKQQASRGIIKELKKLPYPAIGIEVGVNRGINSWYMLNECPNISSLIGVDHYQSYIDWDRPITKLEQELNYRVLLKNIPLMGDRFNLIREDSQTAASLLDDDAYDFVFIDGGHSMKQVLADLDSWYPKVRTGGIIAGHDSNLFSVNFAVSSWYKSKGWDLSFLKQAPNECWFWYKTDN